MNKRLSPFNWANNISQILDIYHCENRFPVNVEEIALEYSRQVYPDDPIFRILGGDLPGFDGKLLPIVNKGWGIIYNTGISSPGRINFTLAHEFGHYLLHRLEYPKGIVCSQNDLIRWDSEYGQVEQQANYFAATLLMPLGDFRCQIDPKAKPTLEDIGACANRYKVSLTATVLQWLEYTERRSVLVVSRDGFMLWSRSSKCALKTGAFFKTVNRPPKSIPDSAIPTRFSSLDGNMISVSHPEGVWFKEPCEEIAILSDQYDFAISLLHLENSGGYDFDEEDVEDTFDRINRRTPGSPWLD